MLVKNTKTQNFADFAKLPGCGISMCFLLKNQMAGLLRVKDIYIMVYR